MWHTPDGLLPSAVRHTDVFWVNGWLQASISPTTQQDCGNGMGCPDGRGWSQMFLEHLLYAGLGRGRDGTWHVAQTLVRQQRAGDSPIQGIGYTSPQLPGESQRRHAMEPLHRDRNQSQRHSRAAHPVLRPHPSVPQGKGPHYSGTGKDPGLALLQWQWGVPCSPPHKCPSCDPRVRPGQSRGAAPAMWAGWPSSQLQSSFQGQPGPICPAQWLPLQAQLATDHKEALLTPPSLHILSPICRPEPWPLAYSLKTLLSLLNEELSGLPAFHSKNSAKQSDSGHWEWVRETRTKPWPEPGNQVQDLKGLEVPGPQHLHPQLYTLTLKAGAWRAVLTMGPQWALGLHTAGTRQFVQWTKLLVHLIQRPGSPCLCSCYSSSTGLQSLWSLQKTGICNSAVQDAGSCGPMVPTTGIWTHGLQSPSSLQFEKDSGWASPQPWVSNCSPPLEPWWARGSALPPPSGFQGRTKGLKKKGKSSLTTTSDNCFKIY